LHKALEFDDTVKQATRDLTGHITMEVMDGEVDGVTDELQLLSTVGQSIQLVDVDIREAQLLHDSRLGLGHRHNLLLGLEFVVVRACWEVVVRNDRSALVCGHLVVALHSWLLRSAPLAAMWASPVAATAVVSALTAPTRLILTLVLVLALVIAGLVVLHVSSLVASIVVTHAHVHLVATFGLIANLFSMSDPVHHFV